MTHLEALLKKSEELEKAATPGPWYIDGTEIRHDYSPFATDRGDDCTVGICEVNRISEKLDHKRHDTLGHMGTIVLYAFGSSSFPCRYF